MKLEIITHSEIEWFNGYIVLNIDEERWEYIFFEEDFIAYENTIN